MYSNSTVKRLHTLLLVKYFFVWSAAARKLHDESIRFSYSNQITKYPYTLKISEVHTHLLKKKITKSVFLDYRA